MQLAPRERMGAVTTVFFRFCFNINTYVPIETLPLSFVAKFMSKILDGIGSYNRQQIQLEHLKRMHRSRTSTGVSDQASLLQMFATSLVPVNSFPHTSHFTSNAFVQHDAWKCGVNFDSTALLDEDLSDDVSCVRRIYLETAQLSGFSFEDISKVYSAVLIFFFSIFSKSTQTTCQ